MLCCQLNKFQRMRPKKSPRVQNVYRIASQEHRDGGRPEQPQPDKGDDNISESNGSDDDGKHSENAGESSDAQKESENAPMSGPNMSGPDNATNSDSSVGRIIDELGNANATDVGGGSDSALEKTGRTVSMKELLAVAIDVAKKGGYEVKKVREQVCGYAAPFVLYQHKPGIN